MDTITSYMLICTPPPRKPVVCLSLATPNNAAGAGVNEAAQASLIIYTELVADFMIENDILSVTLGGFLLLLSGDENMMNEGC